MAVITIHHRPIPRPLIWVIAVVLVAIMTPVVLTASGTSDISTGSDPAPRTAVFDPSFGPNQDLAPVWGIERSAAEATRGPNQDLAPLWGIERSPAEATRGPNQDLAPLWDS